MEEVAQIFGDAEEVAVYQREINVDPENTVLGAEHFEGVKDDKPVSTVTDKDEE